MTKWVGKTRKSTARRGHCKGRGKEDQISMDAGVEHKAFGHRDTEPSR